MQKILLLLFALTFSANAQESTKKLYIKNEIPPAPVKAEEKAKNGANAPPTAPPPKLEDMPTYSPSISNGPGNEDVSKLLEAGPFSMFANPKFKKFMTFLTDKKMVATLNRLATKDKMKFMVIGQIVLIILSLALRSAVTANTRGFLTTFIANTWIMGLHLFLAAFVLPRFLYGPEFFDVIAELYKIVTAT
jgi:hypothetical protein